MNRKKSMLTQCILCCLTLTAIFFGCVALMGCPTAEDMADEVISPGEPAIQPTAPGTSEPGDPPPPTTPGTSEPGDPPPPTTPGTSEPGDPPPPGA